MAAEADRYDYLLKLVMVGESNVGKTSIVTRYFDQTFRDDQPQTVGADLKYRFLNLNGKRLKLVTWVRKEEIGGWRRWVWTSWTKWGVCVSLGHW